MNYFLMVQEKQSWLKNVFDSEYFVFWMALTCLARYKETSVHQYMCYNIFKTRRKEAIMYYPQLFHLMLIENGLLWNRPIFRMLHKISQTERHFSTTLSMYAMAVSDSYAKEEENYTICIDFAQAIVHSKLKCRKPKTHRYRNTLYSQYLKMTYGSKVGVSPTTEHMLMLQKQFYSLSEKKERKKANLAISLKSAISAMLSGLASISDKTQHEFLLETAKIWMVRKNKHIKYKNEEERARNKLNRDSKEASFIHKLNIISDMLIPIPKQAREQALITELNLLNLYLPERICMGLLCPGDTHMSVLNLSVDLSKTLDSATRAPFMLVYEAAEETMNMPTLIEQTRSPSLYEKDIQEEASDKKQATKERVFKTAIRILSGLKELDSSAHVDLDILSIKTRVIRKIYNMHTPQYISIERSPSIGRKWPEIVKDVKKKSQYTDLNKWQLNSIIVKTGSDMKQEQLTSQILHVIDGIWKEEKINLFLNPYKTLVTGKSSGLIETIVGSKSIHQIKKYLKEKGKPQNIIEYYRENWESTLESAQEMFFRSLVAYSLVSYILQIKDRHNGNILIGSKGEMFHIDFGFVLGAHPGFYSVESAPFKFSIEYAEVAGKERMAYFKEEFLKGFLSLRKNMDHIIILVECIAKSNGILSISQASVHSLRDRFQPGLTVEEFTEHVSEIVERGMKNVFTDIYDSLQYYTQGYCK